MSGEEESKIQSVFVDKLGAKYPIIKVDKSKLADYGIRFYPSYYCIDAYGNVHSVPEDRCPSEAVIEELLQAVAPPLPEGSQFDAVRSMWEKRDHARLRDYLDKMLGEQDLDAELRTVFAKQREVLDNKVAAMGRSIERLGAGPDYLAATETLERIAKEWKGFEVGDKAKDELARFKSDSTIKKEIAAAKALQRLLDKHDRTSISQMRKLQKLLPKFIDKFSGTHAATQAEALLKSE